MWNLIWWYCIMKYPLHQLLSFEVCHNGWRFFLWDSGGVHQKYIHEVKFGEYCFLDFGTVCGYTLYTLIACTNTLSCLYVWYVPCFCFSYISHICKLIFVTIERTFNKMTFQVFMVTSMKRLSSGMLHCVAYSDGGGSKHLWNIDQYLPDYSTAPSS
jgi:hypothetical protein